MSFTSRARHLNETVNPDKLALFDLSSSPMTGPHCPLATHGYSRDGKKGLPQIEYELLTDPAGRPVAVKVFPGNTADPTAFTAITEAMKKKFDLSLDPPIKPSSAALESTLAALSSSHMPPARVTVVPHRSPFRRRFLAARHQHPASTLRRDPRLSVGHVPISDPPIPPGPVTTPPGSSKTGEINHAGLSSQNPLFGARKKVTGHDNG